MTNVNGGMVTLIDLPVGWEITDSVEPTYSIPDFELIIRCETRKIAEDTAKTFLDSENNQAIVEKIKVRLQQEHNDIQGAVKQADEWARSLDDFIDELQDIIQTTLHSRSET